MPDHAAQRPIAVLRVAAGKFVLIIASPPGTSNAPNTPCTTRAAISSATFGAIPHNKEAAPKPTSPIKYVRLRPKISPKDPPNKISAASDSA